MKWKIQNEDPEHYIRLQWDNIPLPEIQLLAPVKTFDMISVFHCEDNLIEKRVSPLDLQCKYRVTTMFIIIKYNKQFNRMKAQKNS